MPLRTSTSIRKPASSLSLPQTCSHIVIEVHVAKSHVVYLRDSAPDIESTPRHSAAKPMLCLPRAISVTNRAGEACSHGDSIVRARGPAILLARPQKLVSVRGLRRQW